MHGTTVKNIQHTYSTFLQRSDHISLFYTKSSLYESI